MSHFAYALTKGKFLLVYLAWFPSGFYAFLSKTQLMEANPRPANPRSFQLRCHPSAVYDEGFR
jgi:hypothetical protein